MDKSAHLNLDLTDRNTLDDETITKTMHFHQGKPCTKIDAHDFVKELLPELQRWSGVPLSPTQSSPVSPLSSPPISPARIVALNHNGDNILTEEVIQVCLCSIQFVDLSLPKHDYFPPHMLKTKKIAFFYCLSWANHLVIEIMYYSTFATKIKHTYKL